MKRAIKIGIFSLMGYFALGQLPGPTVPSPCQFTCNDHVYVSMPSNICFKSLDLEDVLENFRRETDQSVTCGNPLDIIITHPFGTNQSLLGYQVDQSHLGYTMRYRVFEPYSGNGCWGYLTVQDKAGPPVPCKNATVSCFQIAAIDQVTRETVDACSDKGSKVITHLKWQDYRCDSVNTIGRVIRTVLASDIWGNSNTCNDTLTIRKDQLQDVCCASLITLPCRMYCLNGEKLIKNYNISGPIKVGDLTNSANWDLVEFSQNPSSANYPTPEFLLKLQGKDDPLIKMGFPFRLKGTKVLFNNIVLPNRVTLLPDLAYSDDFACINPDSLVVPFIGDSLLDIRATIKGGDIGITYDQISELNSTIRYQFFEVANPNYCREIEGKTPMYPNLGGFCKLTVSYRDEILPICGAGFKIRRAWTIADWCTGRDTTCIQYIKIEDHDAPSPVFAGKTGATGPFSSAVPSLKDTVTYFRTVNPHDCYSTFNINPLNVWDCSKVDQTFNLTYIDPTDSAKVLVINDKLSAKGLTVKLPSGRHTAVMQFIDACWNTCNFPLLILIEDITPPNPVCNEITQATVDPATCWARVYAKDLDNGSKDNCCTNLHYAVARMDSLEVHRKAYLDHIKKVCGWDEYIKQKFSIDIVVEQLLSLYDFKEYIDLTECGADQIILRVYDNCNTAKYDPHITSLTAHQWYVAQIYGLYPINYTVQDPTFSGLRALESLLNFTDIGYLNFFRRNFIKQADCAFFITRKMAELIRVAIRQHFPASTSLSNDPTLDLLNELFDIIRESQNLQDYLSTGACLPEFNINYSFNQTQMNQFLSDRNHADDITEAEARSGYVPFVLAFCQSISNDCMINILVDDKTPPVCEDPQDVYWYCDNVGGKTPLFSVEYEYAQTTCLDLSYSTENFKDYSCQDQNNIPYYEIECAVEDNNLVDYVDPTGKVFGWYGCNIYGTVGHVDEHGDAIPECPISTQNEFVQLDETPIAGLNSWAPIYCHSWLCLDRFDAAGKVDAATAFFKPVLRSAGRGEAVEANQFIIWDNCWLDTTLVTKDERFVDKCGNGWLKRTWTAKDKCGSTVTCDQKIITSHRSDFEITFPGDKTVDCNNVVDLTPSLSGIPMVMDDECELVGINYEDEVFTVVQDACYKIVRTWKAIDWCRYDPNAHDRNPEVIVDDRLVADPANRYCVYRNLKDDGDGIVTYTQIIKVIDTKIPEVASCPNDTVCILNGYNGTGLEVDPLCKVPSYTSVDFAGTDNCTAAGLLSFRWELDLNNDGKDLIKSGPNQKRFTSNTLTVGTHKLIVIAEDNCGNEGTTSCLITVRDCKRPTPYCYNGVATVIMPSVGSVTVWASDLNAGSYDNCTKKDSLRYSFDAIGTASRTFTCTDIANGIAASNEVDIYVWDKAGNVDVCRTYLSIQDGSGNFCPDPPGVAAAAVIGTITTERAEPVEHVTLTSKSNSLSTSYNTDAKGTYAFEGLKINSDISIVPKREDNVLNGVSTLDLVLIQKHILGLERLTSPYKIIAADVDKNDAITVFDLVELRKLILTLYDQFPNNTSWRFVPKSYQFNSLDVPWGFVESMEFSKLSTTEINKDFVGIKIGDINGSVVPHSLSGQESRSPGHLLRFVAEDRLLKTGEEAVIEFTAENFNNISGYQFTLKVQDLEVKSILPGKLNLTESNFGRRRLNEGFITSSWNDATGSDQGITVAKNEVLFSIKVRAIKDLLLSDHLAINSKYTRAEAYDGHNILDIGLEVGYKSMNGYTLHQNTPNPFKTSTIISFELAKAEKISLKVTDVTGKIVRTFNAEGLKGYNQLTINRMDLVGSGVFYYTLETDNFTASKKLILIE